METKGFSYVLLDPNKNGQVNDLLTANVLPSEIAVVKTEAHTKRIRPECQGNALADFYSEAATIESINVVDKVHSSSIKNDPLLSDFCHPDVLATW